MQPLCYACDHETKLNRRVSNNDIDNNYLCQNCYNIIIYYPSHRKKRKEYGRRHNRGWYDKIRKMVINYYSLGTNKCMCGLDGGCYMADINYLTIDHINGGGNKHRREIGVSGGGGFYYYLVKNDFPPGYRILCTYCNWSRGRCNHKK